MKKIVFRKDRCIHCSLCTESFKNVNNPEKIIEVQSSFDDIVDNCPTGALCYEDDEY